MTDTKYKNEVEFKFDVALPLVTKLFHTFIS